MSVAVHDALRMIRISPEGLISKTVIADRIDLDFDLGHWGDQPECLQFGDVHVFCASVAELGYLSPTMLDVLSDDERSKNLRFFRAVDANRFLVGRGLLRVLLSKYLGSPADQFRFTYSSFGKPTLDHSLQFNVSHSDSFVLVAFAWNNQIGADIERIDANIDILELAAVFFSAQEYDYLRRLGSVYRERAFYRLWTQKEACVKATGCGLRELHRLTLGNEMLVNSLLEQPWVDFANSQCRVIELSLHADYCASIAIASTLVGRP